MRTVDFTWREPCRAALGLALLSALLLASPVAAESEADPTADGTPASVQESAPDPFAERLSEAGEAMGSRETYPRAIAIYREILAEDPGHREARLWMARLLSWNEQLDAAHEVYAELRRRFPDDETIRVEQAEVLSWAGRYREALEALEAVLEEQPGNARAARAVARIHRWRGKHGKADQAYARALAIQDDAEARAEWEEMRRPYRPRIELETSFFSDSSDFDRRNVFATYSGFQDLDTRTAVRLGWIEMAHPQDQVPLSVRSAHEDDRALDLGLRLDKTLEAGPRVTLEVGGRQWSEASASFYVRGHGEHTIDQIGSLGLHLAHEAFADASNSFEAVQEGIQHTTVAATWYRQVAPRIGTFWRLELGAIDDGNSRHSVYGSVGYRPFPAQDLEVTTGVHLLGYSDDSDAYYAPESDVGVELAVDHRVPVTSEIQVEYKAALGFQSTDERTVSESGTLWSAEGRVFWERDRWTVSLRYGVSYSQRSSRYSTRRGAVTVERRF